MFPQLLLVFSITFVALAANLPPSTFILPIASVNNNSAHVVSSTGYTALDTVYVTRPNATSYEAFYFDAVAFDLSTSVTVRPTIDYTKATPLSLLLSISYPDNTTTQVIVPGDKLFLSTNGQGSSAMASDGSYSWLSEPDLTKYTITLDLPDQGISGQITLQSIAPASAPCSSTCGNAIGTDLRLHWDLLWVNLIPDAVASVNIKANGTAVAFEGSGYHDQIWSATTPTTYLAQYYRGHARLGAYSIVWLYRIDASGGQTASFYLSSLNSVLYVGCGSTDISVRPYGINGTKLTFPVPLNQTGLIGGFRISVDGGPAGNFAFNAVNVRDVSTERDVDMDKGVVERRWIGTVSGGVVNATRSVGWGMWEMVGNFARVKEMDDGEVFIE